MRAARIGVLLRVFIGGADRARRDTLSSAIFRAAHAAGLAGATVLHGPLGFGGSRRINSEFIVEAPGNLPVIVEIIDTGERIDAFLPRLTQLISSGLVTMEDVRIFRCGGRNLDACAEAPKAFPDRDRHKGSEQEKQRNTCWSKRKMEMPHEAVLLRIFTSADNRYGVEEPLYRAIVMKAREMHLAGATVLKGTLGFGQSGRVHEAHLIGTDERPVVIEICDEEEKINAFLPVLDEMMESGCVTLERARVLQYGRERPGYFERLKKSVRRGLHFYPRMHRTEAAKVNQ